MDNKTYAPLLSELAYERILQAFFDPQITMETHVSQKKLVALVDIPVAPVRDALKVLEADGLVKINPRSGIELVTPSVQLIKTIIQFRSIIEKQAARRYALTAEKDEIEKLIEMHMETMDSLKSLNSHESAFDTLNDVERHFHTTLVSELENELIDASFKRLLLMSRFIRDKVIFNADIAASSLDEHLAVLNACMNRDPDSAEQAMATHLSNALVRNLGVNV